MTQFTRICSLCPDYQTCRAYGTCAPLRQYCWQTNDKIELAENQP
jgi:hypothetical protein